MAVQKTSHDRPLPRKHRRIPRARAGRGDHRGPRHHGRRLRRPTGRPRPRGHHAHVASGAEGEARRRPRDLRRGSGDRERQLHAPPGHDVRHPQDAGRRGRRDHRQRHAGSGAGRLRLSAQPRGQLPPRPRRHLRLAQPDPPLRPAHRRQRRGRRARPARGRALLRHDERRADQLRGPGARQDQGRLRQPDAPLPQQAPDHGAARPHREGPHGPGDRHRRPHRQGPALPDRRPAARRQDHHDAERRQGHRGQPSRGLPHGAPDRRAARGSHRHAAHGEGRGGELHLRRARHPPRRRRRDGDREGQALGRVTRRTS